MSLLRILFFSSISLLIATTASATSYEEMNQQISDFEASGHSRFVPASMKKVVAYQGASMLAYEQQKSSFTAPDAEDQQSERLTHAINETLKVLAEAQNNARTFMNNNSALLKLEQEADKAFAYHHNPKMMPEATVAQFYEKGSHAMESAIAASEQGELNQMRQSLINAADAFSNCIKQAMPFLVEETDRALSHASSLGAEKFAPRLWAETEEAFKELEDYADAVEDNNPKAKRPSSIGKAYEMAVFAQQMAIQVKEWRYDNGGHEKLALEARAFRLQIAKTIGVPLDYEKIGIDIEYDALLKQVQNFKKKESLHQKELDKLHAYYKEKLEQQHQDDLQAFQAKLTNIKTAFSTKLEQETFETKRQKKVRDLFKADEAEIIAHLDGSLMIRAKKINFEPGSTKVGSQYFEFLGRIKEALNLYPGQNIRIEGHTDSTGDEKENRVISLKRAEAIQEFLVAAGISSSRLKALGYGEVKPIASNMYKQGRAMNRRIDITIEAK